MTSFFAVYLASCIASYPALHPFETALPYKVIEATVYSTPHVSTRKPIIEYLDEELGRYISFIELK